MAASPRQGIGVIVNPRAKRHRRDPTMGNDFRSIVGDAGVVAECPNEASLDATLQDFRRQGIDVLALSGGDGTTSFVLSVAARVYGDEPLPKVALLRGGTMNTVANSVGVPRRPPRKLLRALVESRTQGKPVQSSRRVLLEIDHDGSIRHGFLFSAGIAREFLNEYYRAKDEPSAITAAQTMGRIALSIAARGELAERVSTPLSLEIEVDGRTIEKRDYVAVMAGTVPQIGLGFRPFFEAHEGVDGFHLLTVFGPKARVLFRVHRVRLGKALGPDLAEDILAKTAVIRAHGTT
ncbi:MAG: diacylglycerol kinase family protein, partial [Myxococcota bacterium]